MIWLSVACLTMAIIIIILTIRLLLIQRSADEIGKQIGKWLDSDTNTLIHVNVNDPHIKKLASELNVQLRRLRNEHLRCKNGDTGLKTAITNISHDLRTPLTAIYGYLDLLKKEKNSESSRRYISIIENRIEVLKSLTEEFFRYSVIVANADNLTFEKVSLKRALEDNISAYYTELKSKGIAPKISLSELKLDYMLDYNALSRILGNVMSNAIKYSAGDLYITLTDDGEIIFSNTAYGLDEISAGKLFDRFYTVENADKSTGLGLSIAKVLTEHMNGSITADYIGNMLSIHINFREL